MYWNGFTVGSGGIQGLVPVGIHHETVLRPSTDQNAVNTDRCSCRYLEHIPADRQETQGPNGGCGFQNFPLHFDLRVLGTGALSLTHRFSAREAE
jgi:hypothetical protein